MRSNGILILKDKRFGWLGISVEAIKGPTPDLLKQKEEGVRSHRMISGFLFLLVCSDSDRCT